MLRACTRAAPRRPLSLVRRGLSGAPDAFEELVKQTVSSHRVVVFRYAGDALPCAASLSLRPNASPARARSKSTCPFCKRTKQLFNGMDQPFELIELNERSDGGDLQMALARLTGQRTVPNVFVNGEHLGGNDGAATIQRSDRQPPVAHARHVVLSASRAARARRLPGRRSLGEAPGDVAGIVGPAFRAATRANYSRPAHY